MAIETEILKHERLAAESAAAALRHLDEVLGLYEIPGFAPAHAVTPYLSRRVADLLAAVLALKAHVDAGSALSEVAAPAPSTAPSTAPRQQLVHLHSETLDRLSRLPGNSYGDLPRAMIDVALALAERGASVP